MQVMPDWCPFFDGYSVESTIPRIPISLDPEKLVQMMSIVHEAAHR